MFSKSDSLLGYAKRLKYMHKPSMPIKKYIKRTLYLHVNVFEVSLSQLNNNL